GPARGPGEHPQLRRQPAGVPGLHGDDRARPAASGVGAPAGVVRPGGADGADQLPDAVRRLHPGLLRLRARLFRAPAARLAAVVRVPAVRRAGAVQPLVAVEVPLRPAGMGLALDHLWHAAGVARRLTRGLSEPRAWRDNRGSAIRAGNP